MEFWRIVKFSEQNFDLVPKKNNFFRLSGQLEHLDHEKWAMSTSRILQMEKNM